MNHGLQTDPAVRPVAPQAPRWEEPEGRHLPRGPCRVCIVISSFRPRVGGAERVTERLCAELRRQGTDVVVVTRRFPGLSSFTSLCGVEVHRLGHPAVGKLGALTFALHALWSLALRYRSYDVVHVQNPDTPLLVGLAACLLLRRRLFFTVHSTPGELFGRKRLTGLLRLRLAARWAEGIVALTEPMAQDLVARGVPAHRLKMLSGGIDLETFRPPSAAERGRARARLGVKEGILVYLFVGRLVKLKRVDDLLGAWALGPPGTRRRLLIVGEGPEGERLRGIARELSLSDVRFEPFTDRITEYLHAADAFILPSRLEGLSVALLEAMATGLAVAVSDLPGNRAVVRHGANGLVFPVGDVESLAARLRELETPDVRSRIGSAAVRTIRRRYSLQEYASRHQDLYDQPRNTETVPR